MGLRAAVERLVGRVGAALVAFANEVRQVLDTAEPVRHWNYVED